MPQHFKNNFYFQEEGKEQAGTQSTQIWHHYILPETKARQNWKHPPVLLKVLSNLPNFLVDPHSLKPAKCDSIPKHN